VGSGVVVRLGRRGPFALTANVSRGEGASVVDVDSRMTSELEASAECVNSSLSEARIGRFVVQA